MKTKQSSVASKGRGVAHALLRRTKSSSGDVVANALTVSPFTTSLTSLEASLANVGAHAGAHRARVTLGYLGDELTVDVADDGAGFDPAVVAARARAGAAGADPGVGTGVGLASVRERLGRPYAGESERDRRGAESNAERGG